jgi:hypothetical protein
MCECDLRVGLLHIYATMRANDNEGREPRRLAVVITL